MSNAQFLRIVVPIWAVAALIMGAILYQLRRQWRRKVMAMQVKYRVQVGDQVCEVDSGWLVNSLVNDLVNGRSKLQKDPVRPEDIRITVFETAPEPETQLWRKVGT